MRQLTGATNTYKPAQVRQPPTQRPDRPHRRSIIQYFRSSCKGWFLLHIFFVVALHKNIVSCAV